MAQKKQTRQTKAEIEKQNENKYRHDRVLWSTLLFALGILTMAFTLIKGESVWNSVHNVLLGLFGVSVFLVPIVMIYVSIMIAMDKTELYVSTRVLQSMILILLLSAFVQIFFGGELQGEGLFDEILPTMYAEGKKLRGGGVLSIIIAGPLLSLFKKAGASIIIILLIFVFIMIMANKTVIDLFKIIRNAVNKASAARAESYAETEDFVPPPGAKNAKSKSVPNQDVPEKVAKEKRKNFNIDIPMPAGQKLSEHEQIKATGTLTEPPKDTAEEPIPIPAAAPAIAENKAVAADKELAKEQLKHASSELDDIIKKAAASPVKQSKQPAQSTASSEREKAAADEQMQLKRDISAAMAKKKQSTLASDKINTTEELDIPDAPTAADIQHEITENKQEAFIYSFPPISLLKEADNARNSDDAEAEMKNNADTLVDTLKSFGVQTRIVDIHRGPTVTRYELQPSAGVKISKITALADDIALNLAAAGVRIEAPIPGKAAVGIEVPNRVKDVVSIREMIESDEFTGAKSKLSFVVGKNIDGEVIVGDIGKMPHVIIAGTTGSGKSVCTNSIIMSILYNASPDDVRLVLIDPKMVEFKVYDGIPHLLIPVVTDPRKAAGALSWAVQEMLKRYKLFADSNVRDLNGYNEMAAETDGVEPLPRIVIAIDELADLMMACSNEVEDSICRLAQMARAAGMHLIIATQRPTVDVITGLIKANIPSRIALTVSSQVDSRTIIDQAGAEKLLGNGDMLYYPQGIPKPIRVQGCFVSTKEVESVVEFIKSGGTVEYSSEIIEEIEKATPVPKGEKGGDSSSDVSAGDGSDADVIDRAVDVLCEAGQASVSYLQRKLKLGYARAARVMDQLEELGVVGPYEGSKPRAVLITKEMWLQRKLINSDTVSASEENALGGGSELFDEAMQSIGED
ncbi:MAG: DNA translocase FtsK [Oscillospiraceae bacterium]|nr:DNA translocase FtsK [Oscillospiraceae bacterium]